MEMARLRKSFRGFRVRCRDGATFAIKVDTARLKKQWRDRFGQRDKKLHVQDFRYRGGNGATIQTKAEAARLSRTRRRRCDQEHILRDRRGSGATLRSERRRCYFLDLVGDGATRNHFLATKAETLRLSRPSRRRRDPCPDVRVQILACPDFRDPCPDFRGQILVCQDFPVSNSPRTHSSRSQWGWRDFQTKAQTRFSRPRRRRCDQKK